MDFQGKFALINRKDVCQPIYIFQAEIGVLLMPLPMEL